jgi:hypothetical protein
MPRQSAGGMRPRSRVPSLSAFMVAPAVVGSVEGVEAGAGRVTGLATAGALHGVMLDDASPAGTFHE